MARPRSAKAERRLKRELSKADLLSGAGSGLRDIIVQFLRASTVNPILGPVTAIIAVDGLYRAKLLSTGAYIAALGLIGLVAGGTVAADVANAISNDINAVTSLFHITGPTSGAPVNDLLSTGVTSYTEVEAEKSHVRQRTVSTIAGGGVNK